MGTCLHECGGLFNPSKPEINSPFCTFCSFTPASQGSKKRWPGVEPPQVRGHPLKPETSLRSASAFEGPRPRRGTSSEGMLPFARRRGVMTCRLLARAASSSVGPFRLPAKYKPDVLEFTHHLSRMIHMHTYFLAVTEKPPQCGRPSSVSSRLPERDGQLQ